MIPTLDQLIPHRGCMQLLDRVTSATPGQAQAQVTITPESSFYHEDQGVPAYIAIEYLAQAIAASSGFIATKQGLPAPIGYLLGTRRFRSNVEWLPAGVPLQVQVEEVFSDTHGMGVYDGRLSGPGIECSCRLNVYQPEQESIT